VDVQALHIELTQLTLPENQYFPVAYSIAHKYGPSPAPRSCVNSTVYYLNTVALCTKLCKCGLKLNRTVIGYIARVMILTFHWFHDADSGTIQGFDFGSCFSSVSVAQNSMKK
jgi:hypothetical protein